MTAFEKYWTRFFLFSNFTISLSHPLFVFFQRWESERRNLWIFSRDLHRALQWVFFLRALVLLYVTLVHRSDFASFDLSHLFNSRLSTKTFPWYARTHCTFQKVSISRSQDSSQDRQEEKEKSFRRRGWWSRRRKRVGKRQVLQGGSKCEISNSSFHHQQHASKSESYNQTIMPLQQATKLKTTIN